MQPLCRSSEAAAGVRQAHAVRPYSISYPTKKKKQPEVVEEPYPACPMMRGAIRLAVVFFFSSLGMPGNVHTPWRCIVLCSYF